MVSKNNRSLKQTTTTPHTTRYRLQKLSVGLVSVAFGTVFFLNGNALADTNIPTVTTPTATNNASSTDQTPTQLSLSPSAANQASTSQTATTPNVAAAPTMTPTYPPATITDLTTQANQVTLVHGAADQHTRNVAVVTEATAGDTITVSVPPIFKATNNATGVEFSAQTAVTPVADPSYQTNQTAFQTEFTYQIKQVNGNISF